MILLLVASLLNLATAQDTAPEPEYPYPKNYRSRQQRSKKKVEAPQKVGPDGSYYYDTNNARKKNVIKGIESPSRVGSDGSYYYESGSRKPKKTSKNYRVGRDGSHYYDEDESRKKHSLKGVEAPSSVGSDGAYIYEKDYGKFSKVLYVRLGVMGPYDIRGSETATKGYKDVYSKKPEFALNIEYEWKLTEKLGALNFKVGSGFQLTQGTGRFATERTDGRNPRESFQFLMIPTLALLTYKFDYTPKQWLVPYVDGGLGYFGFLERRSDGKSNNAGGAPVLAAAVGILVSMEAMGAGIDPSDGYARSWLDLQVRQIVGLDQRKDFTSTGITFGLGLGF